jgi:hypothetical protein
MPKNIVLLKHVHRCAIFFVGNTSPDQEGVKLITALIEYKQRIKKAVSVAVRLKRTESRSKKQDSVLKEVYLFFFL